MSAELKQFLYAHGIATSRMTGYNPQGNGQVERYNGVIWKAVTLALKSRGLGPEQWEIALPNALNSIRSLLCTSINATPHERMFTHQRRHTSDQSGPNWLTYPGTVFMKRPVRQSKYEPMVEKVELIDANPEYAHVRLPDGRETTVSVRTREWRRGNRCRRRYRFLPESDRGDVPGTSRGSSRDSEISLG